MASNTLNSEQLIGETLNLANKGVYDTPPGMPRYKGSPIHSLPQTRRPTTSFTNHYTERQAHTKTKSYLYRMDHGPSATI
jgi:hypothetical protein